MKIESRINSIFEKYRVVFWYDENREYEEVIKDLKFDDVKILKINNNEFGIKVEVLTNTDGKYLIYSTIKPDIKDNWLADLLLSNYEFRADKVSEIMEELGIDLNFRNFIKKYKKFFGSKERVKKFKELIESKNENDFICSMMAILLKSEKKFDYILLNVIQNGIVELEKFNLSDEFFRLIKNKFDIEVDSVEEFLIKLFLNYSENRLNNDSYLFIKFWTENSNFNELFKSKIEQIGVELNIKDKLDSLDKAMECKIFKECEEYILNYILGDFEKVDLDIIYKRRDSFYFKEYENLYNAIIYGKKLLNSKYINLFKFNDFVENYVKELYEIDLFYRKYYFFRDRSENIEALKHIDDKIEEFYYEFLRLNDKFNKYLDDYSIDNKHQRNFYKNLPNNRVFVIISDGLRYECGVELGDRVKNLEKFDVEVDYMVSSLPSYTYLGMASLLPHKEIEVGKDRVFIDGMDSVGVVNRDKILKKYNPKSIALNYEDFLSIKSYEGKNRFKEFDIIYIYHDEIDKMGEKDEVNVFNSVESSFETISKLIKQIRNFNGTNIYITSDHGFLFTKSVNKSEICPKPKGELFKLNRRFGIGKIEDKSCGILFTPEKLNLKSKGDFLIARSINKFAIQGGGNRYVHGSATLQEIVIPLVKVKYKKRDMVREVEVITPIIKEISTNSINLNFYQKDILDDKLIAVTLKAYFRKDGEILSNIELLEFSEDEKYSENREKKVTFVFKSDIQKYNGGYVEFVIEKKRGNIFIPYDIKNIKVKLSFI